MDLIRYPDRVETALLDLLGYVMEQKELDMFLLGGGTSLALRFGHRSSEDLDFFTRETFDTEGLRNRLLALRSLLWFEDAETEPDPILLNGWSWESVKQEISAIVGKII